MDSKPRNSGGVVTPKDIGLVIVSVPILDRTHVPIELVVGLSPSHPLTRGGYLAIDNLDHTDARTVELSSHVPGTSPLTRRELARKR